jgi:predicted nucleic acid-binding protein
MPRNSEIIISDTSCLILISKIGELELLKELAREVFVTEIIKHEFGIPLPRCIEVKKP